MLLEVRRQLKVLGPLEVLGILDVFGLIEVLELLHVLGLLEVLGRLGVLEVLGYLKKPFSTKLQSWTKVLGSITLAITPSPLSMLDFPGRIWSFILHEEPHEQSQH